MQLRRQKTINGSQRHNWNGQDDIFHDIAIRDQTWLELERQETEGQKQSQGRNAGLLFNRKAKRVIQSNRSFIDFCVPDCFKRWLRWYKYVFPRWNSSYAHLCMRLLRTVWKTPILPVARVDRAVLSLHTKTLFPFLSFTSTLRKNANDFVNHSSTRKLTTIILLRRGNGT